MFKGQREFVLEGAQWWLDLVTQDSEGMGFSKG